MKAFEKRHETFNCHLKIDCSNLSCYHACRMIRQEEWRAALEFVLKICIAPDGTISRNLINKELGKEREYPCPKCETGELFDRNAGGMFASLIECDNPDCDYTNDDICGGVTS